MPSNEYNTEGVFAKSVQEFYQLTKYEGSRENVQDFKEIVAELKLFDSLQGRAKLSRATRTAYENLLPLDNQGSFRGLVPYAELNYEDLVIYLEVSSDTKWFFETSLLSGVNKQQFIEGLLREPQVSDELKLAIARGHYQTVIVSAWLAEERNVGYLKSVLHFVAQDQEPLYGKSSAGAQHVYNNALKRIVAQAVMMDQIKTNGNGSAVIASLSPSIITKDSFPDIHMYLERHHHMDMPIMRSAMAVHARRLYDFDESIPDEWVLKAVL